MTVLSRAAVLAATASLACVAGLLAVPAAAAPAPITTALTASVPASHSLVPATRDSSALRDRAAVAAQREVVLVATVSPRASIQRVAAAAEAGPGSVRQVLGALHRISVRVPRSDVAAATARLERLSGVTSVSRAALRFYADVPNDSGHAQQGAYLQAVNAPDAWGRTHSNSSVKIAVIDSGVDVGHPDLHGKIVARYNAHDHTTDVTDHVGHGTFVAGVAAAQTNNGGGVAGAGYDASIMAVKVDYADTSAPGGDAITTDDEAAGIRWAVDAGARILNISLGAPDSDPTEAAAVKYAQSKGALVVAAAGNESSTAKSYPAAYPGVVAVGATDAYGTTRAGFSNHGSWVTLAAPGVGIYSTTPRTKSLFFAANYDYGDGTSFSSPLVAGAAALLLGQDPHADAALLRRALVLSAHGNGSLDLGVGLVSFAHALDFVAPATAPSSVSASGSSGTIALAALSSATAVRFAVDGVALPGLAGVHGGEATASLATYGYANGPHELTAVDCSSISACNTAPTTAGFDLNNAGPVLTAPSAGAALSGLFTLTATAPGGAVAFYSDSVQLGIDTAAPYSLTYSGSALSDGPHSITARQCDTAGTRCVGPASDVLAVTTASLHPVSTSLTPNPFSPNGDRAKDSATLTYSLPDTETVTVSVQNAAGTVVRTAALGSQSAGTHAWTWNGRGDANASVGNGTYSLVLDTSVQPADPTASPILGNVRRGVVLDVTAPSLNAITGNNATVYPVKDGYRDTFAPTVTLGEAGTLSLEIRDARKRLVRTVTAGRAAGATSLSWDGRNSAGRQVGAGAYNWRLVAVDAAGNTRISSTYTVAVSLKRLVHGTATITRNGNAYGRLLTTLDYCAGFEKTSHYAHGLTFVNYCNPDPGSDGFQVAVARFAFTLPTAVSYGTVTLTTTGRSTSVPSEMAVLFRRVDAGAPEVGTIVRLSSTATSTYGLGRVSAAGHVSRSRQVTVDLELSNTYTTASRRGQYDAASLALKITYDTLI